jgi:hypothetical protein
MSRATTERVISLEEVLPLAARGWKLHPCKARDKAPHLTSWPEKATCDPRVIEEWSVTYRDCNWGAKTGADSGVWVLDCDGDTGLGSLDELVQIHGELWLKTLTAITSKGLHYYFQYPPDSKISNSVSTLRRGLDVRGERGYVIVPPSLHPSGCQYRWENPEAPVLFTPDWLLQLLASATLEKQPNIIGKLFRMQRNDGLTRLAGAKRRKGMAQDEMLDFLLEANDHRCIPPLNPREVEKIVASVCRYEMGGPDPLQQAWSATNAGVYKSTYDRFVALFNQLQNQRQGLEIALPLERIAELFGCDWSLIRRYRRRAVEDGKLELVSPSIPHKRAATYLVRSLSVPLDSPTSPISGLVVHPSNSPSGTPPEAESVEGEL